MFCWSFDGIRIHFECVFQALQGGMSSMEKDNFGPIIRVWVIRISKTLLTWLPKYTIESMIQCSCIRTFLVRINLPIPKTIQLLNKNGLKKTKAGSTRSELQIRKGFRLQCPKLWRRQLRPPPQVAGSTLSPSLGSCRWRVQFVLRSSSR